MKIQKKTLIILSILLLIAAAPRAIELLNHNYLFGFDQGEHFLAVKKIVADRDPTLIGTEVGGQGGFFQGPGWYYLLAIPFILFRGDPYGAMIMMFLLGLGTVIAAYLLTKKMFGEKTALITAFLIAISPAIIPQSRFIWPPFPISFLTIFLLFFIYKILQKKDKYLPLAIFTVGLMAHFEIATAATLLISLVILLQVLFVRKFVSLRMIILSIIALLLSQLPLILFDLRNNFLNFRGIINLFFSSKIADYPLSESLGNRWIVFQHNFISAFPLGERLWRILLLTVLIGILFYVKDKKISPAKKAFVLYLVISPILLFIIFLKYGSYMWNWWILELNIYYCFLLAIILAYLWRRRFLKLFIGGILSIFIISYICQTYNFYKNDFNDFGGVHKIKGKLEVIDYIYNDAKHEKFGLVIFTPPIYTYAYDYLLWWHGGRKYGYIPKKEKKGLFYLLIEPDPSKPWTYKGWIETVIKTGKIIKTKKFPSGFIVQKRIGE